MRGSFKQAVLRMVPALEGYVYDVHPPDGTTAPSSYAVVKLGEEVWSSSWAGYRQMIKLEMYTELPGLEQMDVWIRQLIQGLHHTQLLNNQGEKFFLLYTGSSDDDKLHPVTGKVLRTVNFSIYVPETSPVAISGSPDEGLNALIVWTREMLGNLWSVYPNVWPFVREDQAVLWRMTGCETKKEGASMYEVRKSIVGHVVSPDTDHERFTTVQLVEGLTTKAQLSLDPMNKRHLSVKDVTASFQSDPYLEGQIKLDLIQRRVLTAEEAALIRRLHTHPILM